MERRVLVVQCAGLGWNLLERSAKLRHWKLPFAPVVSVFPAVTCPVQATMRTALPPAGHSIIANGRYDRERFQTEFWGQSAAVIKGKRLWEGFSGRTAVLFFQQSLGEKNWLTLSPEPIHRHHGGMIPALHCNQPAWERRLEKSLGPFPLHRYWGPLANRKSTDWIVGATAMLLREEHPELVFTYLPHLDYVQQKEGPASSNIPRECDVLLEDLDALLTVATRENYECCIYGDYAITKVRRPVFPNRLLREAGLFRCREVKGMLYPNLYDSSAFALCDHQVAHLYLQNQAALSSIRNLLNGTAGIASVQTRDDCDLPETAGDLVLTADADSWFAYSWWDTPREAPDYASHVDIHHKIGYDPCELFWKIPFLRTSQNAWKVRGSHGRLDIPAALAVSDGLAKLRNATSLLELAHLLRRAMQ